MKADLQINGTTTEYPAGVDDLESLLEFVMEKSEGNEIIQDVRVDGMGYSEEHPHQARAVRLDGVGSVEIFSCSTQQFSEKFLDQAADYIGHLKSGFETAVGLLRVSEEKEKEKGYEMLARSFETLGALKIHFEMARDQLVQDPSKPESEMSWERLESMAGYIHQAQVDSDSIQIADLIEEKMFPFLDDWKKAA